MITHNGKQVTIAMRNRKPISLIARNGKAMFGEFTAISWAAKAAIIAEYGLVVWQDTRDYAKAHPAIVEFINQDPHLACSISPNSNKERWLVGDGKAYIESGVTPNNTSKMHIRFRRTEASQTSQYGLGAPYGILNPNALGFTVVTDPVAYYAKFGGTQVTDIGDPRNTNTHEVVMSKDGTFYDGVQKMSAVSQTFTITGTYILFGWVHATTKKFAVPYAIEFAKYEDSSIEQWFVPYNNGTECGMLDLVTLTFHPNANTQGTFTIAVTDK